MNKRLLLWLFPLIAVIAAMFLYWGILVKDNENLHYKTFSGNLPDFVLTHAAKGGATLTNTAAAGGFDSRWTFAEDPEGFQIFMPPGDTERLVQALAPVLGQPERRAQYPHILFRNTARHLSIFISTNSQGFPNLTDPPKNQLIFLRSGALGKLISAQPRATNRPAPPPPVKSKTS